MIFYGDTETYSETPIGNGTYRYAEDSEIMLFTWAIDEGEVQCWDVTVDPNMPPELRRAIEAADEVVFQNSMFDRNVLAKHGIHIPQERWFDTMVQAYVHGMPGSLAKLCTILGIGEEQAKQEKRGKALIQLFCKPRPKNQKLDRATRDTHPDEWAEFIEYAKRDVVAMREVKRKLPMWNYTGFERELWNLDQRINDRGLFVDQELAHAAVRAVTREQKALAERTRTLTGGMVESATKRDRLLRYLLAVEGVELPDTQKDTIERRIQDPDLPRSLKELLSVRLMSASASPSKYKSLLKGVNDDGRLRGTLQFAGAKRTARWAGRLFQPQNLPSRGILKRSEIEFAIAAMYADADDIVLDNVMLAAVSAIRGCIIAPPGYKLIICDFSNIEGRVQAWLAGETWKITAFEEYDTVKDINGAWWSGPALREATLAGRRPLLAVDEKGELVRRGPDLYKLAYAKAFKIAIELVGKDQRQIGKVMELMLGYEGGVGAFLTGAETYGFDVEELGRVALSTIPSDVLDEARGFLDWLYQGPEEKHQKRMLAGYDIEASFAKLQAAKDEARFGLSEQAFVVCDSLKRMWRRAHPMIASYWKELAQAVRAAINTPENDYRVGKLQVRRDGQWLRIRLPSGRYLCYPSPKVDENGDVSYMGENQYTRQYQRIYSYGGKFFENVCQAVARDFMAYGMPPAEEMGYAIILTVHDELVTEVPDTPAHSVEMLGAVLSTGRTWSKGMPLAAAGFEAHRYGKD